MGLGCVADTVVVTLAKQSPLLGTVSQWSDQTAEHSHFTLTDLSHTAFTPVAAPTLSEPWTPAPSKHMQDQKYTRTAKHLRLWIVRGEKKGLQIHEV